MIVSRSADYAVRAMIYLARNRSARFIPLKEITTKIGTPPHLTARLMQTLVHGDLVSSTKGHHGGFRLELDPATITAGRVITLIDGPWTKLQCGDRLECGAREGCNLIELFCRAEDAVRDVFEAVSLAQMVRTLPVQRGLGSNRVSTDTEAAAVRSDGYHGGEMSRSFACVR